MLDERTIREQIQFYSRRAYDRRLVGGTGGISVHASTPSKCS